MVRINRIGVDEEEMSLAERLRMRVNPEEFQSQFNTFSPTSEGRFDSCLEPRYKGGAQRT